MQLMVNIGVVLDRHYVDKMKSDELSRWRPKWHIYNQCPISNDIIHGSRYQFKPSSTPPSTKYIHWSTVFPILGDRSTVLIEPFTFSPLNSTDRVRNTIRYDHQKDLITACNFNDMLPPNTGINISHKVPRRRLQPYRKSKKRKMPQHNRKEKFTITTLMVESQSYRSGIISTQQVNY